MDTVEQAIQDIKEGKFVIVVDDENRENEGDLFIAAEKVTPQAIAFMVRYTSGIICVSMKKEQLERLQIPLMVSENTEANRCSFTVSVDYAHGTSSGVSAADRCATLKALVSETSKPEDFRRPGHIFPLMYFEGGVLRRGGHTEASLDLTVLAGLTPGGVLCEVVNDTDGSMARLPYLEKFAAEHRITLTSVADLIRYRRAKEKLVTRVAKTRLPTSYGEFTAYVYESSIDGIENIALVMGDVLTDDPVLVRVHSECLTGDVFHSRRCDCGEQLHLAMKKIGEVGKGVIVYLRGHEGRGIGLKHKLRAYCLQDEGKDTVDANTALGLPVDSRQYGIGSQILVDIGVKKIKLLTNNPAKYAGIGGYDLEIVERVNLQSEPNDDNRHYLKTKQERLGHILNIQGT